MDAAPGVLTVVRGAPIVAHVVRGLFDSESVDRVVVLAPSGRSADCAEALKTLADKHFDVLVGEASRTGSVRLAVRSGVLAEADVVLLADPDRPFTPPTVIRAVVDAVRAGAPSAIPVEPVTDTIKSVGEDGVITGTRDRSELRVVQSPQGFPVSAITRATESGDDLRAGARTVEGHPNGLRVASEFDVAVAEALLSGVDEEGQL